jgi:pyruvate dehydrogenase complex dehydrogenase (E1) component
MVKQKINFTKIRFNQMKRIIIISNYSSTLINFRGHLLKTLVNKGYEVMAIAPHDEHADIVSNQLKKIGVLFKNYSLSRGSLNFLREYNSYCAIRDIIKNYKPHIVIAYTVKGKGFASAENSTAWHHKAKISGDEIALLRKEMNA